MTDETAQTTASDRQMRRVDEALTDAAVGSAPDLSYGILRESGKLLNSKDPKKYRLGFKLLTRQQFYQIGLPAMAGAVMVLNAMAEVVSKCGDVVLKYFQQSSAIEINKIQQTGIDKTGKDLLEAMRSDQLKQIDGQAVIGDKVDKLSVGLAATDKRVAGLAAQQQELKNRIEQQPRH